MARLRVLSGEQVCEMLENYDFKRIRHKGSHTVVQKILPNETITVQIPMHKEIKIGTLRSIIRQSKVDRNEFMLNC